MVCKVEVYTIFFLFKMLVLWWYIRVFNCCVVSLTYCFLHFEHVIKYIRLEVVQVSEWRC